MTTLREFQEANDARSRESFRSAGWNPLEWAGALAGEVGELANLLKKMRRGETVNMADVADEIGDVLPYLAHVATACGLDLEQCVTRKWNRVSVRVGSDRRL